MIIYRPHRGSLADALAEAKEFETEEEMKYYIMRQYKDYAQGLLDMENNYIDIDSSKNARYIDNPLFDLSDIVIDDETFDDDRCGWHDTRYVCVKRMGNEIYDCPQCIGMCATDYEKLTAEGVNERINNMR